MKLRTDARFKGQNAYREVWETWGRGEAVKGRNSNPWEKARLAYSRTHGGVRGSQHKRMGKHTRKFAGMVWCTVLANASGNPQCMRGERGGWGGVHWKLMGKSMV